MTSLERRAVVALAGILASRLFGLFLILPVFTLYAETLGGYTPFLAGVALGIYGLTQACLQLPFGMASDRLGRKPVIAAGLLLFAAGSVLAAVSETMLGVIAGRALQGAGAVSAAAVALLSDLTRLEQRSKAMGVVGVTIGAAFLVSIVLGPGLSAVIGVPGIFWLTAGLALLSLVILLLGVPSPTRGGDAELAPGPRALLAAIRDGPLLRLDIGVFALHAALTATFVVVPSALVRYAGLAPQAHWTLYLPLVAASAIPLFPLLALSDRGAWLRRVFAGCILALGGAQIVLALGYKSMAGLVTGLVLFFAAFNVLEALLPSLISKIASPSGKGTAIGVYGTFQFLGAFVGGAGGGWLHGHYGAGAVFAVAAVVMGSWLGLALYRPLAVSPRTGFVQAWPGEQSSNRSRGGSG